MPEIIIVAGPNGAGKTSFATQYFKGQDNIVYVNADEIARTLSQQSDYLAGREMLNRITRLVKSRSNFVIETTLASLGYAKKIPDWQRLGYKVVLLYLELPSVEISIIRVKQRVAGGGHNIAEEAIRRRFPRSLEYREKFYKPVVDEWYIFESQNHEFRRIATWKDH